MTAPSSEKVTRILEAAQAGEPRTAQDLLPLVNDRYFAGLSIDDTARALGFSPTTVKDEWRFVRAWLCNEINGQ